MSQAVFTTTAIQIDRDPSRVWAVISDYAADHRWRKGIVEMTPDTEGLPQVGTRVHEVLELGGKRYTTDTIVTEVGPGMTYRFEGAGDSGAVRGRRTVGEGDAPGSARFTYEVEIEPTEIARPLRPLVAWMLRRSMRRDVRRLRVVESA
jgi:Polyketide cyclase / dehydrase and lipid transport